jgi:hypothetical protein
VFLTSRDLNDKVDSKVSSGWRIPDLPPKQVGRRAVTLMRSFSKLTDFERYTTSTTVPSPAKYNDVPGVAIWLVLVFRTPNQ